jgi:micrococcal nuclease
MGPPVNPDYCYRGNVRRVVDGDTVDVAVDLGFYTIAVLRFRLDGINAPELHAQDLGERARGIAARDRLAQMLPAGALVTLRSMKTEKYGRWLAQVIAADGTDVAAQLLIEGLAARYDGGAR